MVLDIGGWSRMAELGGWKVWDYVGDQWSCVLGVVGRDGDVDSGFQ